MVAGLKEGGVFRGLARGLFAGSAPAAVLSALLVAPAGAGQPAPAPQPTATMYGESIIQPLREIGHVKARSAFCTAFLAHAALGVSSAIDFEQSLLDTVSDFRSAKLGDELNKHKSLKKLEKDLNRLADLSLSGRAELEELKSLETDPERHAALVDFVDALNGAKGRQMDVARKLSRTYGIIAEQPVYTIVTLPGDLAGTSAFRRRGQMSPTAMATGSIIDTQEYDRALELRSHLFDAVPGDEMVGRDLRRAADHGKLAITLGGC